MKFKTTFKIIFIFFTVNVTSQIQISNFSFNDVPASPPATLTKYDDKIFFTAVNDDYGRELWSSEGSSSSTNMIKDIATGLPSGMSNFRSTALGDYLYFTANESTGNPNDAYGEIWKTDGTEEGTILVTSYIGINFGLTTVGDQIFFLLKPDDNNVQVWKTNGTDSGTVMVKDNTPIWNYPSFQESVNNIFVYTLQVLGTNDSKVWRSDGTSEGTYPITEAMDGNGSSGGGTSDFSHYTVYNNNLYFVTRDHLYKTNNTIQNTSIVSNIWYGSSHIADFGSVIQTNNKMYFSFFSRELKKLTIFESNGTQAGTSVVYNIISPYYFHPSALTELDNNLIFTSANPTGGTSIFKLDTETNSINEELEINSTIPTPSFFTSINNYSTVTFDQLNNNSFFVSSPSTMLYQKNGWMYYEESSILEPLPLLNNVIRKITLNNSLYYVKNNQLWKLDSILGVTNQEDISNIEIFPNPSTDFIYFSKETDISDIKLFDMNGKLVLHQQKLTGNKIDIKDLSSGNYIVKFMYSSKLFTKKIMKKI
jgi:ELWxxDGT repeat protein